MAMTRAEHKAEAERLMAHVEQHSQRLSELIKQGGAMRADIDTVGNAIATVVQLVQTHIAAAAIPDWNELAVPDKANQCAQVREILTGRWDLDQTDGWDEFGKETLDEIMEVFYGHTG